MNTAFLKQLGVSQQVALPLSETEVTIGRDPSCQIALDAVLYTTVSRRHASIRPMAQSNGFEICDLGSANGTFVNGQRLQGCQQLHTGDRLQFGTNGPEFIFEDPSTPPQYAGSDPDNTHPNQALPATIISSSPPNNYYPPPQAANSSGNNPPNNYYPPPQAANSSGNNPPNNYYPPQTPNSSGGVGKIIGIVAAVVIGGLLLYFVSQKNTPSSQSEPPPTTASSPASTSSEAPQLVNLKACPEVSSTRHDECASDTLAFDASTQGIKFSVQIKNPSQKTELLALLQFREGGKFAIQKLGSFPTGSNEVFLLHLSPPNGQWIAEDYNLRLSLNNSNSQPIEKNFSVTKAK